MEASSIIIRYDLRYTLLWKIPNLCSIMGHVRSASMMNINVTAHNSVTLIEVNGRIDSMNANQLGDALSSEIDGGHLQLVLDLANVEYMSSAGLREIVSALKKVRGKGDVRIAQPSHRVREVLEMAGLDTIFQIYPTQAGAVGSY
jgi:anti-sigma B factor antagonist